jgi:hypothetical protein
METVWSGPLGGAGHFDRLEIPHIVRDCLSRSQLKDCILLQRSNPGYDFVKMMTLVALLEEDCKYPYTLQQYGLHPVEPISPAEDTKFSCMERAELEGLVLAFI